MQLASRPPRNFVFTQRMCDRKTQEELPALCNLSTVAAIIVAVVHVPEEEEITAVVMSSVLTDDRCNVVQQSNSRGDIATIRRSASDNVRIATTIVKTIVYV